MPQKMPIKPNKGLNLGLNFKQPEIKESLKFKINLALIAITVIALAIAYLRG